MLLTKMFLNIENMFLSMEVGAIAISQIPKAQGYLPSWPENKPVGGLFHLLVSSQTGRSSPWDWQHLLEGTSFGFGSLRYGESTPQGGHLPGGLLHQGAGLGCSHQRTNARENETVVGWTWKLQ